MVQGWLQIKTKSWAKRQARLSCSPSACQFATCFKRRRRRIMGQVSKDLKGLVFSNLTPVSAVFHHRLSLHPKGPNGRTSLNPHPSTPTTSPSDFAISQTLFSLNYAGYSAWPSHHRLRVLVRSNRSGERMRNLARPSPPPTLPQTKDRVSAIPRHRQS